VRVLSCRREKLLFLEKRENPEQNTALGQQGLEKSGVPEEATNGGVERIDKFHLLQLKRGGGGGLKEYSRLSSV